MLRTGLVAIARRSVMRGLSSERRDGGRLPPAPRQRIKSLNALKRQAQWHEPARTARTWTPPTLSKSNTKPRPKSATQALSGLPASADADQ